MLYLWYLVVFLREVTIHIQIRVCYLCYRESERDPCYVGLTEKKVLKKDWGNKKCNHELKVELCVLERKINNSFEITVIIFKGYEIWISYSKRNLTLSWRKSLSYWNQSNENSPLHIHLQSPLYKRDLRHKNVKSVEVPIKTSI